MRQTFRLGRVASIPIGIHWSVLVIMLLLAQNLAMALLPINAPDHTIAGYWIAAVLATLFFLGSLLAHELSHALVARHYGISVHRVTLWLLGGVAELDGEPPHPKADLRIAVAGPVTSVVCGIMFGAAAAATAALGDFPLVVASLAWLTVVNIVLAVFNLLPGAPLDGGRVLRAILWRIRGDRASAQRAATRAGTVLGVLLIGLGAVELAAVGALEGLWLALIGWFLMSAAHAERVGTEVDEALRGFTVRDVMIVEPVCGYAHESVADFVGRAVVEVPHHTYPVLDEDGLPLGTVGLTHLAQVPPAHRYRTRLADVLVPLGETEAAAPETPLARAAALLGKTPRPILVIDAGHLVGVLTRHDVAWAIHLGRLGARPPARRPLIGGPRPSGRSVEAPVIEGR